MSRAFINRTYARIYLSFGLASGLACGIGCQNSGDLLEPSPSTNTTLHAVYRPQEEFLDNPIVLDGQAIDREWGGSAIGYLNIRISGENGNSSNTEPAYVSMKAIYTDRDLFLLVRWVDRRPDELKDATVYVGPDLEQLPDGCQPLLTEESSWLRNPGGAYDEDRLAISFEADSAGNHIGAFRDVGCQSACHVDESPQFGRLGYGRLDTWQWMAARTNPVRDLFDQNDNPENPLYGLPGYLDDLVSDSFAGMAPDPGTPCFLPNFTPGSDVPLYVYRDHSPDDPYARPRDPNACRNLFGEKCRKNNGVNLAYIWRDRLEVLITPFGGCDTLNLAPLPVGSEVHKWRPPDPVAIPDVPPDLVAGWLLTYPSGSRADVHGKAGYDQGVWTLEIGRRLDTGDPIHDVIFRPAGGGEYVFAVAAMNNSGIIHRGSQPQILVFDPKREEN